MNEENGRFVDDTVNDLLEKILDMELGSKERATEVENFCKLYELRQKDESIRLEKKKLENENLREDHRNNADRKDRWIKVGIDVGMGIGGMLVSWAMFDKGLIFEKDGIITSNIFRLFLNKKAFVKK